MNRPLTLALVLALLPLLPGCMMNLSHVREEHREPTKEELLDLYTTTATYLYDDDALVRAQDQAVKALELEPKNRAMRRMIGWIRLRMGAPEDLLVAEDFFRGLLRDGDENEATLIGLATTLERIGSGYDNAQRRVAAGEQPPQEGHTQAESERELTRLARAHWKESQEFFERTFENGEGSTTAMNGLQRLGALRGDYEESLAWSQRLLERSSAEIATWRQLLTSANLSSQEESVYRESERTARRLQVETHLFAATLLHQLDRGAEALEHLDAVISEEPALAQAYSRRAQLRAKRGMPAEAIADLDRFLALSDAPFEDPAVRRAFALRSECERALAGE